MTKSSNPKLFVLTLLTVILLTFLVAVIYISNMHTSTHPISLSELKNKENYDSTPEDRNSGTVNLTTRTGNVGTRVCSNDERRQHVADVCDGYGWTYKKAFRRNYITVIDKYKLIYCDIPKAGSTSIKTFLVRLMAGPEWHMKHRSFLEDGGFRYFEDIPADEQVSILDEYYKFVVVRHPLDRLRSAFSDKKAMIFVNYKRALQEYFMIEPEQFSTDLMDSFKLENFFELIGRNLTYFQNMHWGSFWDICNPCAMEYDLIMKLEDITYELEELYSYLKLVNSSVELPELVHTHTTIDRVMKVDKLGLISDLVSKFDPKIMQNLLKLYEKDFIWAGYDWNAIQGAVCEQGDMGCC